MRASLIARYHNCFRQPADDLRGGHSLAPCQRRSTAGSTLTERLAGATERVVWSVLRRRVQFDPIERLELSCHGFCSIARRLVMHHVPNRLRLGPDPVPQVDSKNQGGRALGKGRPPLSFSGCLPLSPKDLMPVRRWVLIGTGSGRDAGQHGHGEKSGNDELHDRLPGLKPGASRPGFPHIASIMYSSPMLLSCRIDSQASSPGSP
jgi:hypothetical protein